MSKNSLFCDGIGRFKHLLQRETWSKWIWDTKIKEKEWKLLREKAKSL
jgi:hypothetical protein